MATASHAQAVKSLNNSPGRRRLVAFSQRLQEIDIDVYRSLDKVKSEPSEGFSFFSGLPFRIEGDSQIKKSLKAKRDKRRQEEKRMAVINPMRNAKRKLRFAEKQRASY